MFVGNGVIFEYGILAVPITKTNYRVESVYNCRVEHSLPWNTYALLWHCTDSVVEVR